MARGALDSLSRKRRRMARGDLREVYASLLEFFLGFVGEFDFGGADVGDFDGGGAVDVAVFTLDADGSGEVVGVLGEYAVLGPELEVELGVLHLGDLLSASATSATATATAAEAGHDGVGIGTGDLGGD